MSAPWLDDGDVRLYHGDASAVLASLPAGSVQTCVTSPPYWGLRDYGTGQWEGGSAECDHAARKDAAHRNGVDERNEAGDAFRNSARYAHNETTGATCGRCGARRVDAQLGLERTPAEYVQRLVAVFREVRRVLRDDGTLWLNLGDSYAGSWGNQGRKPERGTQRPINGEMLTPVHDGRYPSQASNTGAVPDGLKPKDLVGIPWRVAFALQADGWYLRSDIIWAKPNPMPESVTDRPTKAHEYVFLLSKQPRYYYDADAVREAALQPLGEPRLTGSQEAAHGGPSQVINGGPPGTLGSNQGAAGRNARSVWAIATQPTPEAHFATFPEELARRCILAGSSERGGCAECGAPWVRIVEREKVNATPRHATSYADAHGPDGRDHERASLSVQTLGWEASCDCFPDPFTGVEAADPVPQLVLDPFAGSGTTALVARKHGRHAIGIDLSESYLGIAARRLSQLSLLGCVGDV